jgi:hypothetical protein
MVRLDGRGTDLARLRSSEEVFWVSPQHLYHLTLYHSCLNIFPSVLFVSAIRYTSTSCRSFLSRLKKLILQRLFVSIITYTQMQSHTNESLHIIFSFSIAAFVQHQITLFSVTGWSVSKLYEAARTEA